MKRQDEARYGEVLDEWLVFMRIRVKESSYARYRNMVEAHIRPELGSCRLSEMSMTLIETFIVNKLKGGRIDGRGGLSEKTASDMLTVIKSTVDFAVCHGYPVSCSLGKLTVKKKEPKMRVLCQSEQDALVRVLTADMDLCKFGTFLALYTGIRVGELCALQWEDVDLHGCKLMVRKTMQRIQVTDALARSKTKIIISEPKSNSSVREIPLPSFLAETAKNFAGPSEAYVLSGKADRYVEPRTMQNHFKRYAAESGIGDVNFHALRHTFATRCVEVGFDIKSLSEILGHANVNMTLNRYVHSSFAFKQQNMEKLTLSMRD
ncbi:MAG: site-specific integrase [Clostridiales bacterium]|nr:site-specific integrase [Clostridiales bacterium]